MYTVKSCCKRQHGFTAYEMLVVMAVLAMIVALAMPAYQRVKSSAESIRCISNLRSWGTSFQMYAIEHDGHYPLSWLNNSDNWTMWIAPYVEKSWLSYEAVNPDTGMPIQAKRIDPKKCGCPGFLKLKNPDPNYRAFPYSYNAGRFDYPYCLRRHIRGQEVENGVFWAAGWTVPDADADGIEQRYGANSWGGDEGHHVYKSAHIAPMKYYKEPSTSEVLFCGWASHWRYYAFPYVNWFSNPGLGGDDYNVRTGAGYLGDNSQNPLGIHGGKDNYLMMDGRVETLAPKDPLVNFYVYNDVPARGNPWRNQATPGSTWFYPGGVIPMGTDPFP